mgnify:CR=1 FL=1
MPSTIEIQKEGRPKGGPLSVLFKYLKAFEKHSNRNIIIYYSGFLSSERNTSIQEEDMNGFMAAVYKMDKKKGLDLFLHTPGGLVSAAEGIGNYLRAVFKDNIHCYVPHMAMSCGTLLAMGCDKIYMGKHSCLGPIDPAFGSYRADAVVEEFNQAKLDIEKNPNLALLWQPIISKYPMTFIGECDKARQLAAIVSRKWLSEGMLRGEKQQESKLDRIASVFASHEHSKMHDRHISPDEAIRTGLHVTLIEDDPKLQDLVMSVHHAAMNYIQKENYARVVSNVKGLGLFIRNEKR